MEATFLGLYRILMVQLGRAFFGFFYCVWLFRFGVRIFVLGRCLLRFLGILFFSRGFVGLSCKSICLGSSGVTFLRCWLRFRFFGGGFLGREFSGVVMRLFVCGLGQRCCRFRIRVLMCIVFECAVLSRGFGCIWGGVEQYYLRGQWVLGRSRVVYYLS